MPIALNYAYVTTDEVRAELGNTDAAIADLLTNSVNRASRLVDDITGTDFLKHDFSSTPLLLRRGTSQAVFMEHSLMPRWPIISLAEVREDDNLLVLDQDYYVDPGSEIVRIGQWWALAQDIGQGARPQYSPRLYPSAVNRTVSLKGVFGYAWTAPTDAAPPAGLPARITRATRLIAAAISGENQKETVSPDGGKLSYVDKRIPSEALNLLKPWKPL